MQPAFLHDLHALPADALCDVQSEGAQRDILLLDIALDSYFRTCIERIDRSSLPGDDIVELVTMVLKNAIIASENEDLAQVAARKASVSFLCA